MSSNERNLTDTENIKSDQEVDWSRYGLGNAENRRSSRTENSRHEELGPEMYQTGTNELFAQEFNADPWWKSNFFISQPVLFGTWDGVFTSCLINIFGVIVFLRSGWIVGQAGALNAVLIIFCTTVGICERCRVESGGVYFLLSHVLGSRFGGSIGLLYCFGQAVGCALNVLGFGESMAGLVGLESTWAQRGFACAAVILLSVINVAGVKWVIKLQFILLLILLFAGFDFIIGSFTHTDPKAGFVGWSMEILKNNTFPSYQNGYSWFTVFGVFFPTVTGVLAGINMSGDLRHPSTDIPNGTLAALGLSTVLYLCLSLFLASTCTKAALQTNFMIASTVSAFSVLLLAGLYVSSFSSCLGAMYGTPRVLQSIASQNVIPGISCLQRGRGPNKVPVYAMLVVAVVTLTFIMTGQINTLAPIVTMPFLLTYACMDYAYFALAQTFDLRHSREQRFSAQSPSADRNYGTSDRNVLVENENDLDYLFPERTRHKNLIQNSGIESNGFIDSSPSIEDNNSITRQIQKKVHIHGKLGNWYSPFCNRWFSLLGSLIKLLIMFLVHWGYALANIIVCFLVWSYIGHANPAVKPGVSAEFKFFEWLKNSILKLMGRKVYDYEQIVVTPVHPGVETCSAQLNEENEDFAGRRRYHQIANVTAYNIKLIFK
ncbi:PREDICTED: solute carrier family 12 member 8 isoform X2 [Ceratosolen solmsi marchali]|uniref:Solute carrier family 12 member 8 n=1 Tax=Ceratosolen solmsi marchali TaxID=326594 RepID=A0AAJ6YRP9_9HYME|nr:PREDICTED: solute carrier family 12 member 8 isoform X2 [Ceratosolen solmsi marchali]